MNICGHFNCRELIFICNHYRTCACIIYLQETFPMYCHWRVWLHHISQYIPLKSTISPFLSYTFHYHCKYRTRLYRMWTVSRKLAVKKLITSSFMQQPTEKPTKSVSINLILALLWVKFSAESYWRPFSSHSNWWSTLNQYLQECICIMQ